MAKKPKEVELEAEFKSNTTELEKKQLTVGMLTLLWFKRLSMCRQRTLAKAGLLT